MVFGQHFEESESHKNQLDDLSSLPNSDEKQAMTQFNKLKS